MPRSNINWSKTIYGSYEDYLKTMLKEKEETVHKYTFEFEYSEPRFASVDVETKETDIDKVSAIAKSEFEDMYPEAVDPEIISWSSDTSFTDHE